MADSVRVKVRATERLTPQAVRIEFEHPEGGKLDYLSGQYITLILPVKGKEVRRAYSLCSARHVDEFLSVGVKEVPGGTMSPYLNKGIEVGEIVTILPPQGRFTFEPHIDNERKILLIGGGSGITPLLSILKSLVHHEPKSTAMVVYSNRDEESTMFKTELEELVKLGNGRVQLVHRLDSEHTTEQKKGLFKLKKPKTTFLTEEELTDILEDTLDYEPREVDAAYLCGPTGLMQVAEQTLLALGEDPEQIHKEHFVNPNEKGAAAQGESSDHVVTLKLSGQEIKLKVPSGKAILKAGLDAGYNLPFSCQSGLCTACMGRRLSGEVEMRGNEALTDSEVAEGLTLTCCGYPMSDDVVISYDDL